MDARPRLKAALLDFDGTLVALPVDWERLRVQVSRVFAECGSAREFRPLYATMAQAYVDLEERGVPPRRRASLRRKLNRLMTEAEVAAAPKAEALPGSREVLERLRDRGWRTMIQTSNSVHAVREVWDRLALPPVDAVVGRESARRPKPDPQGVCAALRRLGVRGPECVVVGDGDFDVALGRAIGALTIRVRSGDPRLAPGAEADFEAESLGDVIRLLAADRERATAGA